MNSYVVLAKYFCIFVMLYGTTVLFWFGSSAYNRRDEYFPRTLYQTAGVLLFIATITTAVLFFPADRIRNKLE